MSAPTSKVRSAAAAALLLAGTAGVWFLTKSGGPGLKGSAAVAPPPVMAEGGALKTNTDAAAVFQRAFWRRPGAEDVIKNAERREWIDAPQAAGSGPGSDGSGGSAGSAGSAGGVRKWQWFIEVKPGAGLRDYLLGNPFQLEVLEQTGVAAGSGSGGAGMLAGLENPPAWFPGEAGGWEIWRNREGTLIWLWSEDRNVLFAADAGFGFQKGAR